jgi:hypothetical protein
MTEIYQVGHLERVPLGTPYPGIVAHVGRLLGKLPGRPELAIDLTGVGRPVFDMFVYSGISPVGVQITGGAVETRDGVICNVPKILLISRVQALLHEGRLKILRDLPEADTLVRELQDFRVEFTAAGHLTFNARSGKHDDLVLALAIATWSACGGGMASAGAFELARQQALGIAANEPRYFVGLDLGQAHDPTAIAIVRKVDVADPAAAVSVENFTQVQQPESTALPPDFSSQAYRDELAEGMKALVRRDPRLRGARTSGAATGPLARLRNGR